ncbi:hypothetical protein KYC5002_19770 [Archangium violaceum]|uniref:hypothetical protein n=1 Tax=Archangium violaceum TaxID=83451 RepID=UPI002B2A2AB2|nr:hypothetical protein KYC5002_19770 [Archangium gephyra]
MSHVRWEDLLDEEEQGTGAAPEAASGPPAPQGPPTSSVTGASPESTPELEPPALDALPRLSLEAVAGTDPELAELLRERRQLEGKMNALLGVEDAPVDARLAKQFPVVEHTPETRIADRRQHERDTAQRLLEQKLYARRRVEREEAERVEELRRRRVESGRAQRRKQAREAAKRQEQARKAQERLRLAARLAERLMQTNAGTGGQPRLPEERLRQVPSAAESARARPHLPLTMGKGTGTPFSGGVRAGLESLVRGRLSQRGLSGGSGGGLDLASMDTDALVERGLKMAGMDMDTLMDMEGMDVDGMDMEGMDVDGMDMDGGTRDDVSTRTRRGRGAMDE